MSDNNQHDTSDVCFPPPLYYLIGLLLGFGIQRFYLNLSGETRSSRYHLHTGRNLDFSGTAAGGLGGDQLPLRRAVRD